MTDLSGGPWESVAVEFKGPIYTGDYLLVVIDEYSRFAIVEVVHSTSSVTTILKLDKIFSEFGIPMKVKSDNGPPFQNQDYEDYANYMGFKRPKMQPCFPQANVLVELFNKVLQKILAIAKLEPQKWRRERFSLLRDYRTTPHSTTGVTPADLMFQKMTFRTRLPEPPQEISDRAVKETDSKNKQKCKRNAEFRRNVKQGGVNIGDLVLDLLLSVEQSDVHFVTPCLI